MDILLLIEQIVTFIVSPFILILIFCKIDKEYTDKIKPSSKDITILIISSVIAIITSNVMLQLNFNRLGIYQFSLLIAYLLYMTYTDQKTELLYSVVSIIMIIIEVAILIINRNGMIYSLTKWSWAVLIPVAILLIMSIFRLIGFGDCLIYIVLAIYYLQYRPIPLFSICINIAFTNIMFLTVGLVSKIIKKDNKKFRPLTLYITISTFICGLLVI